MRNRVVASHAITIAAPIARCQMFFTPAGEELWVDHWIPHYIWPTDGRTVQGMVFATGTGVEFTIWSMTDFDTDAHYARYSRVTPASRCGYVEVQCKPAGERATLVTVTYTLTALTEFGADALAAYEGSAFVAMIEDWKSRIDARLPQLLEADIR